VTAFAVRNFCVSRFEMLDAWAVGEYVDSVSAWCDSRVVRVRESFFRAVSASRRRRSRAWERVVRDSLMRETASLSGVMLKLEVVWWMS
jgi:hypothetical protein